MPKKKNVNINYTNRSFESIKADLIDHAKRFYPDNYKDFTTPSFGSMMLDSVAYIGDVLSFYVDYNVNESFLDTSIEFDNIRKHARALGYNFANSPSTFGTVAVFILCPSNSDGTAPDMSYLPTLKLGSSFRSIGGGNFILTEDVRFNHPKNHFVAARFDDTTGATTHFAVKAYGQVQSGIINTVTVDLNDKAFERFKKIAIGDNNITEIISVIDASGNKYYEVDNLAQEVIFVETTNKNAKNDGVRSILKPFVASRRYVIERDDSGTYMQFGFGSEDEDSSAVTDPAKVAIKMHAKKQISNTSFDPTKLLSTNKFGVSPYNTVLTVIYRTNLPNTVNAPALNINTVVQSVMIFENPQDLNSDKVLSVKNSIEVINEEPISGFNREITADELKIRAKANYAMQNRAVTKQDYESIIYQMPPKFGAIKRANIVNDPSSTNRKISIFVISENDQGHLSVAHDVTKNNIKNWMSNYIPMNDTVELKDALIVNYTVDFSITYDRAYDPNVVLFRCVQRVQEHTSEVGYIGEPLYITRIYEILNKLDGVIDVKKVTIKNKTGGKYSSTTMNLKNATSRDGTYIKVPKNVILELKYPSTDIKGTVR